MAPTVVSDNINSKYVSDVEITDPNPNGSNGESPFGEELVFSSDQKRVNKAPSFPITNQYNKSSYTGFLKSPIKRTWKFDSHDYDKKYYQHNISVVGQLIDTSGISEKQSWSSWNFNTRKFSSSHQTVKLANKSWNSAEMTSVNSRNRKRNCADSNTMRVHGYATTDVHKENSQSRCPPRDGILRSYSKEKKIFEAPRVTQSKIQKHTCATLKETFELCTEYEHKISTKTSCAELVKDKSNRSVTPRKIEMNNYATGKQSKIDQFHLKNCDLHNLMERQEVSLEPDLKRKRETENSEIKSFSHANTAAIGTSDVKGMLSIDHCGSNMAKFQNEFRKLEQPYPDQPITKCHQLKMHRTTDYDFQEVIRDIDICETQHVLDKIKLIEDHWKTVDLQRIVHLVNFSPATNIDREELLGIDETLPETEADMILRKSVVLCSLFDDSLGELRWKVEDALDIGEYICDVVGKLMMRDRSSMLNCMQNAVMNIEARGSKPYYDKLRSLLITWMKYNGLNLACIHLERMVLDNKVSNAFYVRTVCAEFIVTVLQLIIESSYQDDLHCIFDYLVTLKPHLSNLHNLMKNGLPLFQYRQDYLHRYLKMIRNFDVPPSSNYFSGKNKSFARSKCVLYCRDEDNLKGLNCKLYGKEEAKSCDQVLSKMNRGEIEQAEKDSMRTTMRIPHSKLVKFKNVCERGIVKKIKWIQTSEQEDVMSSFRLAVTSMALCLYEEVRPPNTQLVSYCFSAAQNEKRRLLEILTGEDKSCVIAVVAATYALQGRTVYIVTSSPVLSQRDAGEWREFYSMMKLEVGCNVEDNTEEDTTCYDCPIVYGTVETFARDILKTEFLLQDVRKGRKCDIVIVDEVDSMLIDQGVQCTYLSHDVASIGMRHVKPILALIWMHVSRLTPVISKKGIVFYSTEPEDILVALSRLSGEIDPLQILRLAEEMIEKVEGIKRGFTDEYMSKDLEGQREMLSKVNVFNFFKFARNILHLDMNIYSDVNNFIQRSDKSRISVIKRTDIYPNDGLFSVVLRGDVIKDRLMKMMTDSIMSDGNQNKIDLPIYLRAFCVNRLRCWIDNAFLANEMEDEREYIDEGDVIYLVDFKSTGVIETNKKWGDGLQQFLEMKHGSTASPSSLITNLLSDIDFFERYGSNIVGLTRTLGNAAEKKFMRDTLLVEFATIPTSKPGKILELDGLILENKSEEWLEAFPSKIKLAIASQRAVLVICEDFATANEINRHLYMVRMNDEIKLYLHTISNDHDGGRMRKEMKPGDVVITTNLGARGTDFVPDDVVNKNGGLFVLVTFIPLNDRVEKQAFGHTGRRGATGSCQIIVNREAMPEWSQQCEMVKEAKRLRDSIEMHRLENMTEVNLMKNKQQLFREYCELKMKLNTSSSGDSADLKIQNNIIDETWAKWIQDIETRVQERNMTDLMEELRRNIEVCFNRAKRFVSDNIYHIMEFGTVRHMKEDFEGASKFYDRVINIDPDWSAFAHYNRTYCTIHIKGDGYIRRAIDDLRTVLCKLETYKQNSLCSDIHANVRYKSRSYYSRCMRSKSVCTMMECQLFNHIDSQIIETIEKLETIDAMKGEATTVRQDILDSIPTSSPVLSQRDAEEWRKCYTEMNISASCNVDRIRKEDTCCFAGPIVCGTFDYGGDADGMNQLVETEQEMIVEEYNKELNSWERQGVSLEPDLKRTRETEQGEIKPSSHVNAVATETSDVKEMLSIDHCRPNMAKFRIDSRKLEQQFQDKLISKCHQLKIHRTTDDDLEEVILDSDSHEKLDHWRTADLWETIQLFNPCHIMNIDQELLRRDELKADITLKCPIVLCCIFEDLVKKKLISNVEEPDRSSLLNGIHTAVMNLQAHGCERNGDTLRSLLITKKKYNGLNLACILLEQMALDNKDNNVFWMRIVCSQFIDLVVSLNIESEFREDINWNLNHLMKLGSLWSVWDIYVLMRNDLLLYRHRQAIFHRKLVRIRNFAVQPSLNAFLSYDGVTICMGRNHCSRDDNTFMCIDSKMRKKNERDKSLDQIFNELNEDTVGKISRTIRENYNYEFKCGIETKPERSRNFEEKNGNDVLPSCLSVIWMALNKCADEWKWEAGNRFLLVNKQLGTYCLLVSKADDSSTNNDSLKLLTMENCSVVIAKVAPIYALLGRTADIVIYWLWGGFDKWRSFYTRLNLSGSFIVNKISEGGSRLTQSILYCRDEDEWECSDESAYAEEEEKSLDQILKELKDEEVGQEELSIKTLKQSFFPHLDKYRNDFKYAIEQELERIRNSEQKNDIAMLSSCLSVTSMTLCICEVYLFLNAQLVNYCFLVARKAEDKDSLTNANGSLLEILISEGKSFGIAMLSATYNLLEKNADLVTSSLMFNQRDAEDWKGFFSELKLGTGCNVDEISEKQCCECSIVYDIVVTFADVFLATSSRLSEDIDSLQIVRLTEEDEESWIREGFNGEYLGEDIVGQKRLLSTFKGFLLNNLFVFALKYPNLDFDYQRCVRKLSSHIICSQSTLHGEFDIIIFDKRLSVVLLQEDSVKERLTKMILEALSDQKEKQIDLPIHPTYFYNSRSRYWIDNAILAKEIKPGRDYVVCAINLVEYTSTGAVESNTKKGNGFQQFFRKFLEMKQSMSRSPLFLITNFSSNNDLVEMYENKIVRVSETLGIVQEKQFMRDTSSVEFLTIPTIERMRLSELYGWVLYDEITLLSIVVETVESALTSQRTVFVICKDNATAKKMKQMISRRDSEEALYSNTRSDNYYRGRLKKELKTGDMVTKENLGARGTDFPTDCNANKNGERVGKQAFDRTGRRGATGSCQILVSREAMPEWLRNGDTLMEAFRNGRLDNDYSLHLKNVLCNIEAIGDESVGWMSQCASKMIITGIISIDFIHDVSSLATIKKQPELGSNFKMTEEASEFTQFANSQARYVSDSLEYEKKLLSFIDIEARSQIKRKEYMNRASDKKVFAVTDFGSRVSERRNNKSDGSFPQDKDKSIESNSQSERFLNGCCKADLEKVKKSNSTGRARNDGMAKRNAFLPLNQECRSDITSSLKQTSSLVKIGIYKARGSYRLINLVFFVMCHLLISAVAVTVAGSVETNGTVRQLSVMAGQSVRLQCSLTNPKPVKWRYAPVATGDPNIIYLAGLGILGSYRSRGRHSIEDGTNNLIITNATDSEAGKYTCEDEELEKDVDVYEIVILKSALSCKSNIDLADVIGENDCGIEPDLLQLHCSVAYFGNFPPRLRWQNSGGEHAMLGTKVSTSIRDETDHTTESTLTVTANMRLNDTYFTCQVADSQSVGVAPEFRTKHITVQSLRNSSVAPEINLKSEKEISCTVKASQPCKYQWTHQYQKYKTVILGSTLNFEDVPSGGGIYECQAECRLRGQICLITPRRIIVVAGGMNNSDKTVGGSASPIALIVSLVVFIVVFVVAFTFFWKYRRLYVKLRAHERQLYPTRNA